MSEIEKMMQNAGIDYEERYNNCTLNKEGECKLKCSCDICKYSEEKYIYPSFTAEKQIELIKLIANNKGYPDYEFFGNLFDDYIQLLGFDEALAGLVNSLWKLLSEEKKEAIRGILRA